MPSESSNPTLRALPADTLSRAAAKGAATLRRHRQERRADSLAQIRSQIADGTLVVRQMTVAERKAPDRSVETTSLTRAPASDSATLILWNP
jgi:hypothetical protein